MPNIRQCAHKLANALFWVALAACVVLFARASYASAEPNEWLIVVSNGAMTKAGVGIASFINPFVETAVRMPASIHKVSISAQQVSAEMQGVEVSGFIVWTVNSAGEGPLKCYKYLDGLSEQGLEHASAHIKGMAESIIRHQVANLNLREIITNRTLLREKVRSEMLSVVQGWGIWLETVEVTDTRVLSYSVSRDLEAEFKLALNLQAEERRINTARSLSLQRLEFEREVENEQTKNALAVQQAQLWADLEYSQENAKVQAEDHKLQLEQLEKQRLLRLKELELQAELDAKALADDLATKALQSKAELELLKKRLEVEKAMGPAALEKALTDATKEIFSKLPINEIDLHNFASPNHWHEAAATLVDVVKSVGGNAPRD